MGDFTSQPEDLRLCCPECDYNLTGAPGDRCPWCGWRIDVEELTAPGRRAWGARIGVVIAAVVIAGGSLLAVTALTRHAGTKLVLLDGITVLAVVLGVGGHLVLAGVALLHWGENWPMRGHELASGLRWAAWASVIAGVIGAGQALHVAPRERGLQGTQFSGVLEFVLRGLFFTLPGWTLGVLRLVSFRGRPWLSDGESVAQHTDDREGRATFAVEWLGGCERSQVVSEWRDEPRSTTPAVEAVIARIWEAEQAVAELGGRRLFNGKLIRLIESRADANTLTLVLGPTDYRDFLGTNLYHLRDLAASSPPALADALGVSAVVVTRDGFLVLGRRSDRVHFHSGYLHPFGGMVEEADRRGAAFDVFGAILRELGEELGVRADEIAEIHLLGLVRDRAIRQPELCFETTVALTREELFVRFRALDSNEEHAGLEFVRDEPEAILPFLLKAEPVTPIAAAALLLHGRGRWGEEWYDRACFMYFKELPPRWPALKPPA